MPRGRKRAEGSAGGQRVTCIITGRTTLLNTNVLKAKLQEYGSIEDIQKHYICREAAKYLRRGISQKEIRKLLSIKEQGWIEYDDQFINSIISKGGKVKKERINKQPPASEALTDSECFWRRDGFRVQSNWDKLPIDVAETTKNTCLRPDIFLDYFRCSECNFFKDCTFPRKNQK